MAGARYSDERIDALIKEAKTVPTNFKDGLIAALKKDNGHLRSDATIKGASGNTFKVAIRKNDLDVFDFSIIIYLVAPTGKEFILRRYNGNSHRHTNRLEKEKIDGFHIHHATQRYQENTLHEEGYAEVTTRYSTYDAALDCLLEDCGFEFEASPATTDGSDGGLPGGE